jgi:hypothetical protein
MLVSVPPAGFHETLAAMIAAVKGEGVCKVVDAEGKPKIMYQGTTKDSAEFQHKGLSRGFFFTESPESAEACFLRPLEFRHCPACPRQTRVVWWQ